MGDIVPEGEGVNAGAPEEYNGRILAIDPGTTESGWCLFEKRRVVASGIQPNPEILKLLERPGAEGSVMFHRLAIEMIASYGMPVGRETFETVLWIGRMVQASHNPDAVQLVYRQDVKLFLCGSARAKDPNVRQALLDLFGPVGTKKQPGPLYGVSGHVWSALAVAATVAKCRPIRGASAGVAEHNALEGTMNGP